MAVEADRNAPHIPRKPGELRRCGSHIAAPPGIFVASDFKYDTLGIGKCVGVGPMKLHDLGCGSDFVKTLSADDAFHGRFHGLIFIRRQRAGGRFDRCGNRTEQVQSFVMVVSRQVKAGRGKKDGCHGHLFLWVGAICGYGRGSGLRFLKGVCKGRFPDLQWSWINRWACRWQENDGRSSAISFWTYPPVLLILFHIEKKAGAWSGP